MIIAPLPIETLFQNSKFDPEEVRASLALVDDEFAINTRDRLIPFLATISLETTGMSVLEENLRYTTPVRLMAMFSMVKSLAVAKKLIALGPKGIGNFVYANRLGNGDEASGDGWRFRGQGLTQLTGRTNFIDAGNALGLDLISEPERAQKMPDTMRIAAWFWQNRGCNALADAHDMISIRRAINGPKMVGLEEFIKIGRHFGTLIQEAA